MDCGPASSQLFAETVASAKTVIWNGPAGVFEFENFSNGTNAILKAVAALHSSGGVGIIGNVPLHSYAASVFPRRWMTTLRDEVLMRFLLGGGDSATAAANAKMEDKVSYLSSVL